LGFSLFLCAKLLVSIPSYVYFSDGYNQDVGKAFFWCFTQQIIKKKREEGGKKGGKEGEKRREKIEGRVKGELPQVIPTANGSGKGCWDSSVF
jgi:hypothetical protein